ncbi:endolytic transglycosylase MltG [Gordonia mangrovi]|uniref:endolytic transglycosylase MltG n=1 Tax=Gordonia mangrovi TaxID=2665643 RepID=UPI0021AD317D|nr:endolytic transglycosylase MltG [Gordonia mangrovi]UVF77844.1 endolytic transglycosylase MltG [Gordonia mangrovi]
MTDERHRPRRHDLSDQPTEQLELDRLRYFTQPTDGKPTTRHRRRRAVTGEPSPTGPQPVVEQSATPPSRDPYGTDPHRADAAAGTGRWPAPPAQGRPIRPQPEPVAPPAGHIHDSDEAIRIRAGEFDDPMRRAVPHRVPPRSVAATPTSPAADPVVAGDRAEGVLDLWDEPDDVDHREPRRTGRSAKGPRRSGPATPGRLRKRVVLAIVLTCMLILVVGVGFVGLRAFGAFENTKDYTNTAGTADVVVDIPQNSTLMDFGQILQDNDVVASVQAFIDAADGQPMSGGFYKMRTQIPAATAVEMMTDGNAHRVGRMVVPEGLQLDNKEGVDGKITPGIFQMIENATAVTVNGQRIGTDVAALETAAAEDTPEQLGVPDWARPTVQDLTGDHRRIEGLIAPGTWETIDPEHTPTQILRELITASAARFEQWGLLEPHDSGLTPYETLVTASIVEREVTNPDDYAKVARVILNRLDKGQRLEMDSTANYTAAVTNIDVYGEAYRADNEWNTYRIEGLPATPIGAVGERALTAVEYPTPGDWLYFVTIDQDGTTLFADTFAQHQRNRDRACDNELLTTGCS